MYHGIINVYKEPGCTSYDVMARLRGTLKQKKTGHTGTLDPAAEGVLPVCLGIGTRLCDMLTDWSKTYQAVMLPGCETGTQDTTGITLVEDREGALSPAEEQVDKTVMGFKGDYAQIPPMYSALKVDGKKLYELARAGEEVGRRSRAVQILDIRVSRIELPGVWMEVTCSKGTYIRTLCRGIGRLLGCEGCTGHLIRTRVDRFSIEDSLTLGQLEQLRDQATVESCILPVEEALQSYPPLGCLPEADSPLHNKNPCFARHLDQSQSDQQKAGAEDGQMFRMYDSNHKFTGAYQHQKDRHWQKPWKMFLMQLSAQRCRNIWDKGKNEEVTGWGILRTPQNFRQRSPPS